MRCWIPHTGLNTNCRLKSLQGQRRLSYDLLDNSLALPDKHEDLTDCHECLQGHRGGGEALQSFKKEVYFIFYFQLLGGKSHLCNTLCL